MPTVLRFGATTVEVYPDSTRIIFPDDAEIVGAPQDTDAYRATARQYGYGDDTLTLCQEHEVMHIALTHWLGIESVTMRVLRGEADVQALSDLEEAAVLAVQRFARAAGVNLIEVLCRDT
jgi:hypothetical protein